MTTTRKPKAQARKPKAEPEKRRPDCLMIDDHYLRDGDREKYKDASEAEIAAFNEALTARALAQPDVRAARTIQRFEGEALDINACANELREQIGGVQRGDMKRPEAMLVAQAHTLDALFSALAMRSYSNSHAGYLDAADRYMRLALKAQSQCRTTIEVLAEIKNPRPVAFVKQANISNGHQQVNNGVTALPAHGNNSIQSNELSGAGYELLPDTRASALTGRIDTPVAAMEEVDRATN